jgi:predicted TPR repeat methyltransferase
MIDCLSRCADGELPANVALMQLFLEADDEGQARHGLAHALVEASNDPARVTRLAAVQRLWRRTPDAYPIVVAIDRVARSAPSASAGAGGTAPVTAIAALFDRAASISPTAGVALYSLGDTRLLEAATQELVRRIGGWHLLGAGARVLDLGCGSGRMLTALAPIVATVTGVDVSRAMVETARANCAGWPNASVRRVEGRDLQGVVDGPYDLIIAIDSFPYLVAAGVVEPHMAECHRLLRPRGHLLVMNYSYGGSVDEDSIAVQRVASAYGFAVVRSGARGLRWWDGTAFLLRRAA